MVEDEASCRAGLSELLKDEGIEVMDAKDGREASEILKKFRFDLVITDMDMPEMTGMALIREIKATGSSVPVIVITASSKWEGELAELKADAATVLYKPFSFEELINAIRRYLQ